MNALIPDIDTLKKVVKINSSLPYESIEPYIEDALDIYIKPYIGKATISKAHEDKGSDLYNKLLRALGPLTLMLASDELGVMFGDAGITVSNVQGQRSPASDTKIAAAKKNLCFRGMKALDRLISYLEENKKDYPDAETQVRSKSKNRFSIGGKSVWDLGWIAVEPDDGMTVESIMDSKGTAVGTTTWGEAKKLISASGMEVSEKAYAAMDGKSDDTMVIYMDRNTYNQYIFYNNIIIRLKNSDGNTENVEIKVQDSHYWINKALSLGEKIEPLSLSEVKKLYDGRAVSKDEFNIRKSTINGSPEDCLIESSDGSDEYIANRVGMAMVDYTDKKTGMSFEVDINIKLPDNAVKTDDIIFDDVSRVELYGAQSGSYMIYHKSVLNRFSQGIYSF